MICRLIPPKWLDKPILEGDYTDAEIAKYNHIGYNVYTFPNPPTTEYTHPINGSHITRFDWVFVDFDLKSKMHISKEAFLEVLFQAELMPSQVIDSGGGIHAYWSVSNLDAISYVRFQRRLCRLFNTDEAVGKICQLMRVANTMNTKVQGELRPCTAIYSELHEYTAEEFDKLLPNISVEDEAYCQRHYEQTYNLNQGLEISDTLPPKFGQLIQDNAEAKELFAGTSDDRSKSDFRLGHIMLASGFTKAEAMSVLVNCAKALQRAPTHRNNYAANIVDKIWTAPEAQAIGLSNSVKDILNRPNDSRKGVRIPCWRYIDDTIHGFRQGHVLGLVAGSGVGKTALALNIFMGFVVSNPDLEHFFVPLEETDRDIAMRWQVMCGDNHALYEKVHVLSNYTEEGTFRDLSLDDIKQHILEFQKTTNKKVGCVVIDHIGVLCNENKLGQDEGVKKIAKEMKGFAEETQTFLIMQSQTARSKAGRGDLELNKDSAFGTSVFENFCDYLVTLWQPLKLVYELGAPTVMAYKFCKIRHKNQKLDVIKEDMRYTVFFDPETQLIRELKQDDGDLPYWLNQANNKRKQADNRDIVDYVSIAWGDKVAATTNTNRQH